MDRYPSTVISTPGSSALTTNKVLRNTYMLLSATLAFSAAMAGVAMVTNMPSFGLLTLVGYFALLFAVHKTRNSSWGLVSIFALTGFMGLTLGPILNFYLRTMPDGSQVVMTALGATAAAFLGLSAYAIKSGRDFSFMSGFLFVGAIGGMVLSIIAVLFQLPTLSLVVAGMFLLISSGIILWQTGEIVRGGETNYIVATVTLYVSIYNIFLSLLQLLGAASDD